MTIGWWSLFEYRDDPIEGGVDPSLNTLVDNIMYYNVKNGNTMLMQSKQKLKNEVNTCDFGYSK